MIWHYYKQTDNRRKLMQHKLIGFEYIDNLWTLETVAISNCFVSFSLICPVLQGAKKTSLVSACELISYTLAVMDMAKSVAMCPFLSPWVITPDRVGVAWGPKVVIVLSHTTETNRSPMYYSGKIYFWEVGRKSVSWSDVGLDSCKFLYRNLH